MRFSLRSSLAAMAMLLLSPLGPVAPASAQSIVIQKKLCPAANLPAVPSAADFANCANVITAGVGALYYYVVTVGTVGSAATATITDPMPAGFVPTTTPPPLLCTSAGCAPGPTIAGSTVSSPVSLTAGPPSYLVIPGYFNAAGMALNAATVAESGKEGTKAEHSAHVDPAKPLPGNLAVSKEADIQAGSLGGGGGSISVHYTITLANTGATDLYLGGLLELVDSVGILPGPPQASSLLFGYDAQNFTTTPSSGSLACPELTGGNQQGTTNASTVGATLGVWTFPAGAGQMPAGSSCVYEFDVTYTLTADVVCVWPNTTDGVRNTAYVRFASGTDSFSDMAIGDNTSTADLEITDTGVTEECDNTPQPPAPIKLIKEQTSPAPGSGDTPWGTPVTYIITVDNQSSANISNVLVTDYLSMAPGMPVFDATITSAGCLNSSIPCTTILPAPIPTTLSYNANNTQVAAQVNIPLLPGGASQQIEITVVYKALSCVSYETKGPRQTANSANIKYKIPYKYGLFWSYDQTTPAVITDHEKVEPCALKVGKDGPKDIVYGSPFQYEVTFENAGSSPVAVGTLMDAISLSSPNYASSISGVYNYGCAYYNPSSSTTALPWPAGFNLVAGMSGNNPFSVGYHSQPEQGTRLIHNLNPAAPIVFPPNSKIVCTIKMTLDQPASSNPYCQGAGKPKLVNSALMDVTHYYNTNLQPHTHAYAATEAGLPHCHAINVGKSFDKAIVSPGQQVIVTLSLANIGDDPINGATLTDILPPGLAPVPGTAACTPACAPPATISGQTVTGAFGTLAGNETGTITFTAIANGPAPVIRQNTVTGAYTPPAGNWYDQGSSLTATSSVGVYDLVDLHITKTVINTSGQPFPTGPFPMTVSCQLPLGGTVSYTASATIASGNQVTVTVSNVPVGSICAVTESSVPAGLGGLGFNSVGYAPQGAGANAEITVEKDGKNEVFVENCYGEAGSSPLATWHDPGKECPAVGTPVFEVKKDCGPAYLQPDDTFIANCTVTVSSSGPAPNPVHLEEVFSPATGTIAFTGSTPYAWTCSPANVTLPNTMNCSLPGGTMTAANGFVSTLGFTVTFGRGEDPSANKNCAVVTYGEGSVYACTGFEIVKDPPRADIEKKCGEPLLDSVSGEYKALCSIYVTLSGPQTGQILVQDTMQSAPNGAAMITALTAAGWTCTPALPVQSGQTLNCKMPGANFPVSGQSVIVMEVTLFKGEKAFKNCAGLFIDKEPRDEDCSGGEVTTADPIKWDVEKICQPLAATNPNHPLQSRCTITVTASGQPTGPVTVNDVLAATGSAGQITAVAGAGWSCSPTFLPISAGTPLICVNATFPSSLTSSFDVTVSYPAGTRAVNEKNCATLSAGGVDMDRDCVDLVIGTVPPSISVAKTCQFFQQYTDAMSLYLCQITVTATGSPLPPMITLSDTVQNGAASSTLQMQLWGLSSTDPWTCPTGGVGPNSPYGCSIAGSAFPAGGVSTLSGFVTLGPDGNPGGTQNCATATGNTAPPLTSNTACAPIGPPAPTEGRLSIEKIATLNGQNIPQQTFVFAATCGATVTNVDVLNGGGVGLVTGIPFGTTCSVQESEPPLANACPSGQTASWSTTYAPATPLTFTAQNPEQTVTVTNVLTCTPEVVAEPPPVIAVTKTCAPGMAGMPGAAGGMTAGCTITVTNSGGPVSGNVVLYEGLDDLIALPAGSGSIIGFASAEPWQFPPTPIGIGSVGQATLSGSAFAQAGDSSTITVTVAIGNAQMAGEMQNCVSAGATDPTGSALADAPRVCAPFTSPPSGQGPATATKTCAPVNTTVFPVSINCFITVTLNGALPPPNMIDITERLFDADTGRQTTLITAMSSTTPGWTLPTAFPINANIDSHLQISGAALAAAGGTSTINVTVQLPDPGTANYETRNCIQLRQELTGDQDMANANETSPPLCAPFSVTVPQNIVVTPPACDPASATSAGDRCRCRFDNMAKISDTACACAQGFSLAAGKGCVKKTVEPKCDAATTVAKGGACACKFANMVKASSSACACAQGFRFAPGRGCFKPEPVCGKSQVLVKGACRNKEPVCAKNQVLVKGRCVNKQPVCKKPFVYDPKRNACVEVIAKCGPRQIRVKGRCVNVPKCGVGQIPVPGIGVCVSIGIGGGPRPDGPRCNPAVQKCG